MPRSIPSESAASSSDSRTPAPGLVMTPSSPRMSALRLPVEDVEDVLGDGETGGGRRGWGVADRGHRPQPMDAEVVDQAAVAVHGLRPHPGSGANHVLRAD